MVSAVSFVPFEERHIPLFYAWAEKPFVKETWFQEGYEPKEAIVDKIEAVKTGDDSVVPYLITHHQQPIGFIQYYILSKGCWEALEQEPEGTFGFDVFIGEEKLLNQGIGTELVKNFTDMLLNEKGAARVVVDPSPDNHRAIGCYKKAGYQFIRSAKDNFGRPIYIMEYCDKTIAK